PGLLRHRFGCTSRLCQPWAIVPLRLYYSRGRAIHTARWQMKIGIVSDTHNRHAIVATALDLLRDRGVNVVLHCGDIEDEATVRLFRGLEAHFVFGNCDTDRDELDRVMAETGATSHGTYGTLELAGRRLAWTHGDDRDLLRDLERAECFD